jgi:hypothetical protein
LGQKSKGLYILNITYPSKKVKGQAGASGRKKLAAKGDIAGKRKVYA